MSCGVGRGCGLDPTWLWLWHRLVAVALNGPLAWEPPYAMGAALKKRCQPVHVTSLLLSAMVPRCSKPHSSAWLTGYLVLVPGQLINSPFTEHVPPAQLLLPPTHPPEGLKSSQFRERSCTVSPASLGTAVSSARCPPPRPPSPPLPYAYASSVSRGFTWTSAPQYSCIDSIKIQDVPQRIVQGQTFF